MNPEELSKYGLTNIKEILRLESPSKERNSDLVLLYVYVNSRGLTFSENSRETTTEQIPRPEIRYLDTPHVEGILECKLRKPFYLDEAYSSREFYQSFHMQADGADGSAFIISCEDSVNPWPILRVTDSRTKSMIPRIVWYHDKLEGRILYRLPKYKGMELLRWVQREFGKVSTHNFNYRMKVASIIAHDLVSLADQDIYLLNFGVSTIFMDEHKLPKF